MRCRAASESARAASPKACCRSRANLGSERAGAGVEFLPVKYRPPSRRRSTGFTDNGSKIKIPVADVPDRAVRAAVWPCGNIATILWRFVESTVDAE